MALYMIKRILPPWRDRVALVLSNRSFYRGTTTSKIVMPLRPCTRLASETTTAAPAATAAPIAQPPKVSSTPSSIEPSYTTTVDVITQMKALEEDALRVLYEPRPNTAQLVAIVRGLVQLGGLPSHEVVRALVNHLTSTRDAQSSAAMLSLLKRVAPPVLPVEVLKGAPTDADSEDYSEDDPIAIVHMMHLCLVNALCRRRDLTGALGAVADMERDTGRPAQAKVFVSLLKACAISRPPMLREADTVWEQVEEREFLTSARGVQQELFASRMMVYASCAGYPPFHETSPEESRQVLQQKVDGAWNDMLAALSPGPSSESGDASERDGTAVTAVTTASWIARANAMSLCSRGSDAGSGWAMSRSLEALESYLRAGGNLSGDSDMAALAEVVRGLARSGRQEEVVKLLRNDALAAATAFDADTVTYTGTDKAADRKAAMEKVRARTAATHSSLMPERLLRALGARGAGRDAEDDQDERRAYGTSLLEAIEGIALEARLSGRRDLEGVDARLTAVLQAILAASHFLGRDDSGVVDVTVQRALDAARADASAAASAATARDVIDSDRDAVESREWSGPGVAALSLVALLRVSKQPRQGIAGALDVLQEMHDRKMSPPPTVAGQLDAIVRRHGTKAQKRRAVFLLAEGLKRVGNTEEKQTEKVMTRSPTSEKAGVDDRAEAGRGSDKSAGFGLGKPGELGVEAMDEIGAMVRRATESRHRAGEDFLTPEGVKTFTKQPQMQRNLMKGAAEALKEEEERLQKIAGARGIELACALATEDQADYGTRAETSDDLFLSAASTLESHRGLFRRVTAMAERGRAHAALSALQKVDGRKKGNRVAVPYRVYALLFRALAGGYSARDREELELAASPTDALQWLLRGLARQGYKPGQSLLNFGLEAFAVAAKTKKVQEGGEKARRGVCTAALDFLEGMKTGWNGLHPPVQPNVVSYSIVIKTMCRLWMFDEAFQVLDLMERNGCTPDRVTYSTLIHGLSKAGDNDGAWEVLVTMTNKGITPHSIAIDGIVDGFVRSGEVGEAISFAQHAFNQYGSPPTPAKFCRMMHAAAELDDGKHEARRAVIVAEQLWPQEWKGEGRSSHPVLGHPQLKGLLREKGVFDGIGRL